jgi:hypothetical protein
MDGKQRIDICLELGKNFLPPTTEIHVYLIKITVFPNSITPGFR